MKQTLLGLVAVVAMFACSPSLMRAQDAEPDNGTHGAPPAATTVTNATGTISQLNYSPNGTVEGFLIGANILLTFPGNVTGGVGTLGAAGNSVTYSGSAVTNSSGFQAVHVTSFTNNTTKAAYTAPTPGTPTATSFNSTVYVKQLNYDDNGNVDGFLYSTSSGGAVAGLVSFGSQASTTLKSLLTAGAQATVIGTVHTVSNATVPTLPVVNATSIQVGSQTIVIGGPGRGPGGTGGPGGPGGHR